ncbi:MAG: hypothetical protein RIQ60_2622 [Pseudomonadota bacterium]|jgi:uncharacterized protein (PEP-CTERM system associated)
MATTTRPESARAACAAAAHARPSHPRHRLPSIPWPRLSPQQALLPCGLLLALAAQAQQQPLLRELPPPGGLRFSATIGTDTTATTNVGLDGPAAARSDLVLGVTPQVRLSAGGAGWRLQGEAGAAAQLYANHSRRDRLLPRVDLKLGTELVEHWLSLDARTLVTGEKVNPFGGGSVADVSSLQTTSQMQLSPTLDHEFAPGQRLRLRSDVSRTYQSSNNRGDPSVASSLNSHLASYGQEPRPLGWRAEITRLDSRNRDLVDPVLRHDSARAMFSYVVDPQVTVNLNGGRDRASYGINQRYGTIEGLGLLWQPTPGSRLDAQAERHFYGLGWKVKGQYRGPNLSINIDGDRDIGSYAAALGSLLPGGTVADLLDRMLAGRITDPAQRAIAVQDLISRRGLPTTLSRPTELFSSRAEIRTRANLSVGLLGVRHVLTLNAYSLHTQDLPGDQLLTGAVSGDARQHGWSVDLNRRLDPRTSSNLSLARSRSVGLGINSGRESQESSVRLGFTHELTARTTVSGGVRRALLQSQVLGDANENAVFAGAVHRF